MKRLTRRYAPICSIDGTRPPYDYAAQSRSVTHECLSTSAYNRHTSSAVLIASRVNSQSRRARCMVLQCRECDDHGQRRRRLDWDTCVDTAAVAQLVGHVAPTSTHKSHLASTITTSTVENNMPISLMCMMLKSYVTRKRYAADLFARWSTGSGPPHSA